MMPISRIFQPDLLSTNKNFLLSEAASHHLARVLRAKVDDEIILFNGQGGEYLATILQIDKKNITVKIGEFNSREAESPLEITLAQGVSRGEKMDYTIQKAVELGVKKIIPILSERCNVKLDDERREKRLAHWKSIIISACEQSGRNRIPEILPPLAFEKYLALETAEMKFILSPHVLQKINSHELAPARVSLLIGPEGGLSNAEVQLARQKNFLPLNLGPRILRTETAAIAAISALQSWFGDFK